MADFTIAGTPRRKFVVDLAGVEYTVKAPKASYGLKMAKDAKRAAEDPEQAMASIDEWLTLAVGAKQAEKIAARLLDDDDLLDVADLGEMIQKVSEAAAGGNPTT